MLQVVIVFCFLTQLYLDEKICQSKNSGPEHDLRNIKIVPCENHKMEFGVDSFFNVISDVKNMPMRKKDSESYMSFEFDISAVDSEFIGFQVC